MSTNTKGIYYSTSADAPITEEARSLALANSIPVGPNYIINGAMDINQRGLNSTGVTTQQYTLDRWLFAPNSGTVTQSYQPFTPGSGPASSVEAAGYLRTVTSGQSAAGAYTIVNNNMEDVRALAGRIVTISFYAKASVNGLAVAHEFSQNYGTGGSPSNAYDVPIPSNGSSKFTLTTSWARYSYTMTLPSLSGKTLGTTPNTSCTVSRFWLSAGSDFNARTSSLGLQAGTVDLWGLQIEEGSYATPFRRNALSLQAELAACQRYYVRIVANPYSAIGSGFAQSSTRSLFYIKLPTTMRVPATSVGFSNLIVTDRTAYDLSVSSSTDIKPNADSIYWCCDHVSGSAQYRPELLTGHPTLTGYFEATAEL